MHQMKRSSCFTEISSGEKKKLRTIYKIDRTEISSIEQLSNEIFYEIFEYLDVHDIYEVFLNLNVRFRTLLFRASFPLRLKLSSQNQSELQQYSTNIIIPNRHHILSFNCADQLLIEQFLQYCIFDSAFSRLESITLSDVLSNQLLLLLFYFKSLPRLYSLTTDFNGETWMTDLSAIYRLILSLPFLKYNKLVYFCDDEEELDLLLPLAINEQFSPIEKLVINHNCTLDELLSLLRRTPHLRRLTCGNVLRSSLTTDENNLLTLENLTYLSLKNCELTFNHCMMFLTKVCPQLQLLNIRQLMCEDYLDADRWERLIRTNLPHLRQFEYQYRDLYPYEDDHMIDSTALNEFTSLFWIERQCSVEMQLENDTWNYCIRPYKDLWLDIYKNMEIATYLNRSISDESAQQVLMSERQAIDTISMPSIPTIQLTIDDITFDEQHLWITDYIQSIFDTVHFTRLKINGTMISIDTLVKIIDSLPNLGSLKISSLAPIPTGWLFDTNADKRFLMAIRNKITEVNLETMDDIEQVHFLLYLCLRAQYIQMGVAEKIDLETLLRFIATNARTYIPYLNSVSFCSSNATDESVQRLREVAYAENLLSNCTIKRIANNIVLKWIWPY